MTHDTSHFPVWTNRQSMFIIMLVLELRKSNSNYRGDVFLVGVTMFVKDYLSPENEGPRDRWRII